MFSFKIKKAIFFLGLFCFSQQLVGQLLESKEAGYSLDEHFKIIVDRSVYSVTETVYFNIVNFSEISVKEVSWSMVIYVELISPSGQPFIQKKIELDNYEGNGFFILPKELLTGTYYLRAYTKWMRNFSPYLYAYKPICIINPFLPEILENAENQTNLFNYYNLQESLDSSLLIKMNKTEFNKREHVDIEIINNSSLPYENLSISIVKDGTQEIKSISIDKVSDKKKYTDSIKYIPETRGISFSGKVVNKFDSLPISYAQICLTVLGDSKEYLSSITDSSGRFYFSIPNHNDSIDVFISSNATRKNSEPLIFVENDFCNQRINLPNFPFIITEKEKKIFNPLIINAQLSKLFYNSFDTLKLNEKESKTAFYGIPSFTLQLDRYIQMNDLEDYFKELIPPAKIYKNNDKKRIRILGEYAELLIYEPLVLVNYIPYFNIDALLTISPKLIERIEVVSKPYVMGSIIYGGIVHIILKNENFEGIQLPSVGQFFTVQTFQAPYYKNSNMNEENVPNTLNCLYWNPNVSIAEHNFQKLSFTTGDSQGKYFVIIQGFTKEGKEILYKSTIEIRN